VRIAQCRRVAQALGAILPARGGSFADKRSLPVYFPRRKPDPARIRPIPYDLFLPLVLAKNAPILVIEAM